MKYLFLTRLTGCFGLFFVIGFQVLSAQDTTLQMIIPNQSQETQNWCWAASMKMIMDFHSPSSSVSVTQCALVKELFHHEAGIDLAGINCCTDCHQDSDCTPFGTPCSGSSQNQLANKTIPFTDEFDQLHAKPDFFDLIFTKNGYSSVQEVNQIGAPFKWEHIKEQIKQCRPFIINVQDVPGVQATGNHALVVKGYKESLSTNSRYIITNDPWRPCCTKEDETLLSYDVFTTLTGASAGGYFVSGVLSTVHSIETGTIFEEEGKECRSCELLESTYSGSGNSFRERRINGNIQAALWGTSSELESITPPAQLATYQFPTPPQGTPGGSPSRLLELLNKNPTRVAGYQKDILDKKAIDGFYESEVFYTAPVKYMTSSLVNRRYFLACLFPPKKLEKVIISDAEVVDVVSGGVDKDLVSTLQKREDGNWVLRGITTYTHIDKDIGINMANAQGDSIFLKNTLNPENTPDRIPYTLVKYRPFQYEFFSFTQNGKKYMAPAATYDDLGLEGRTAYREGKVIRSLRRDTRNFEKFIKSLFGKPSEYKVYTGEQKGLNSVLSSPK